MEPNESKIPLWRQLQAVATVLQSIRGGVSGTVAVEQVAAELRPGVQALSFHVLRFLGRAQVLREALATRPPPPAADALLCTALALAWCDESAPYEVFTLVNQTVEAAKRSPVTQAQANFINACLRRFLRERVALVASTDRNPLARWNHPLWWISRLKAERPHDWQSILQANNRQAPMTLRVNRRQTSVADYLQRLADIDPGARATGEHGIVLGRARPVHALPGFSEGMVSVQDSAAQLAAPLLLSGLASSDGPLKVLDACAAPGGKTAHLLEYTNCDVTALELDVRRSERIHQTLTRLNLSARVVVADAAEVATWWRGQLFDAILLDAPCSASGIVRRHPDVRWLRRESDLAQLAAIQTRLLAVLWPLVKPGGRLLYCTCSVFRAEGEDQIQAFLARNTNAQLRMSPGHLMPGHDAAIASTPDNAVSDHDGFYYALLEKNST